MSYQNRCNWLLQTDIFEENINDLALEIEKQGHCVNWIKYYPMMPILSIVDLFKEDDCVVFYGSLNLAKLIRKWTKWIPGVYCNLPNYNCSNYYTYFGKWHLAEKYCILPYGDLIRQKEFIFDTFGDSDTVFLRPNSGDKIFTGQTVAIEDFEKEVELLGTYSAFNDTLCIISPPVNLVAEWRFIVVEKNIVAGSQYHDARSLNLNSEYPKEAFDLAQEIANSGYQPDHCWTLDICKTKSGDFRLLEIGSFSCAGIYLCDKKSIVKHVSEIALKEKTEYD